MIENTVREEPSEKHLTDTHKTIQDRTRQNHGKISIIITIRLTDTLYEAQNRLISLCNAIPKTLFEIVIVDYGSAAHMRDILKNAETTGTKIVEHPKPKRLFSIGAARDYGAQHATSPALLFIDIDFYARPQTFHEIYNLAHSEHLFNYTTNFVCIPVLFLTEQGTHTYLENHSILNQLTFKEIEQRRDIVAFPSYGSSAIMINRLHYLSIGGHQQVFKGHGAEDFELLHRLSSIRPWGNRPADYYKDTKIKSFDPLSGFRPYFARYALPAMQKGIFLIHRHHPKRKERGYFRHRRNFFLLQWKMRSFDKNPNHPLPLTDLHSSNRTLILIPPESPEFNKARRWIAQSCFYIITKKSTTLSQSKIQETISKHSINLIITSTTNPITINHSITNYIRVPNLRIIEV